MQNQDIAKANGEEQFHNFDCEDQNDEIPFEAASGVKAKKGSAIFENGNGCHSPPFSPAKQTPQKANPVISVDSGRI